MTNCARKSKRRPLGLSIALIASFVSSCDLQSTPQDQVAPTTSAAAPLGAAPTSSVGSAPLDPLANFDLMVGSRIGAFGSESKQSSALEVYSPWGPNGSNIAVRIDAATVVYLGRTDGVGGSLRLWTAEGERVLAEGVSSFAVSAAGRLAVTQLVPDASEYGPTLSATISVSESLEGVLETWVAEPRAYKIEQWIGDQLMILEGSAGGQAPNLLAITAAGTPTLIAEGAGFVARTETTLVLVGVDLAGQPFADVRDARNFERIGLIDFTTAGEGAALGNGSFDEHGSFIAIVLKADAGWWLTRFERSGNDLVATVWLKLPWNMPTGMYDLQIIPGSGEVVGIAQVPFSGDTTHRTALAVCDFSLDSCYLRDLKSGSLQVEHITSQVG